MSATSYITDTCTPTTGGLRATGRWLFCRGDERDIIHHGYLHANDWWPAGNRSLAF